MTFKDHCDKIIIGLILVVAIIIYYYTSYSSQEKLSGNNTKKYTVYGSMNCGWTTKQLDEIKKNGHEHMVEFVDCDKNQDKCQNVEGFPTWKVNGSETLLPGYKSSEDYTKL